MTVILNPSPPASQAGTTAAQQAQPLLDGLGRAQIRTVSPTQFAGRNGSWIMELTDGSRIFVKKFNTSATSPQAFARSMNFSTFARNYPQHAPSTPKLLAGDESTGLLLFDYCSGTSLVHLIVQDALPVSFAADSGRLLARLHSGPTDGLEPAGSTLPVQMLRFGVTHTRYLDFTLAELSLYPTLQQDGELLQALEALQDAEETNRKSPIHGDLRWDQFHLNDSQLNLLDWEDFCLGDPARDIGTLAGEWIYRAVLDTVTSRGGADSPPEYFDENSATTMISHRLAAVVPQLQELWHHYRLNSSTDDSQLALRVTARLGWHLVDRSMARAAMVSRLPGIERAAAGIGRRALLDPARYSHALGFGKD